MVIKILLSFMLTFSLIFANDSTETYFSKGKFSLQYQVLEDFSLTDFQGSIISARYFTSDRGVIRIGFSSDYSKNKENLIGEAITANRIKSDSFMFGVETQYLYYITNNNLSLYTGLGPKISYINSSSKLFSNNTPAGEYNIKQSIEKYEYGLGILAVLGGEYFVTKYLSIIAEYGIICQYELTKIKHSITGERENEGYELKPLKAKLGVSFNF